MILNGVLKTSLSSNSAFSGYISTTTPPITSSTTVISKIPVNTELVDSSNEFNLSNNTFTPASSGIYEIELQINVQSAALTLGQSLNTAPCGLVDQSSGLYITRWQYPENTLPNNMVF
ncbi:hypothetical protein [Chryseobacterium sp. MEBOG07]|uniref:hypothetical protein n=1 Tax=Chryseobacterium sp. MEBOG07 TaxID=2879939 RepID=UPI001F3A55DE|nr:hypothetical protein [Chryseobacterium sp. MEBOG07]UKB78333.1 hypothetical protein LF886_17880 [Chryseobacterium sp. MEBOG07]